MSSIQLTDQLKKEFKDLDLSQRNEWIEKQLTLVKICKNVSESNYEYCIPAYIIQEAVELQAWSNLHKTHHGEELNVIRQKRREECVYLSFISYLHTSHTTQASSKSLLSLATVTL
jgi:hypothetical protein